MRAAPDPGWALSGNLCYIALWRSHIRAGRFQPVSATRPPRGGSGAARCWSHRAEAERRGMGLVGFWMEVGGMGLDSLNFRYGPEGRSITPGSRIPTSGSPLPQLRNEGQARPRVGAVRKPLLHRFMAQSHPSGPLSARVSNAPAPGWVGRGPVLVAPCEVLSGALWGQRGLDRGGKVGAGFLGSSKLEGCSITA